MELQNVLVLGAGTMGKQIAVQCAAHGYRVILCDIDGGVLSRAKQQAAGIIDWISARGHLEAAEKVATSDRRSEVFGLAAQAYHNAGSRTKAMQAAQTAVKEDSNNIDAWQVLVVVRTELGEYDQAALR